MEKKYHIPDGILRTLICDFCHKFLSVGPVKLYHNRKINCGRCFHYWKIDCGRFSYNDDVGVISNYGLIAKHLIFKCVNRFDGCRQLLSYAEAETHELTCKNKAYVCPLCRDEEIPTFLFIKHFKESHPYYFLETPSFKVNMSSRRTRTYLYEAKDNLFFIQYSVRSVETISLTAMLLGEPERAEGITQKFTLHCCEGSEKVETEMRNCGSVGQAYSGGYELAKPKGDRVNIMFELYIQEFLESPSEKSIGLPRNIILSEEMHKNYPGVFVTSSSSSLFLKKNNVEILLHCYRCSMISTLYETNSKFLAIGVLKFQYVCVSCKKYYDRKSIEISLTPWEILVSSPVELSPFYSCAWQPWGCSASFNDINEHEIECQHQPVHLCPVSSCIYRGKLSDLHLHCEFYHSRDFIQFQYEKCLWLKAIVGTHHIWAEREFVSIEVSLINSLYVKISLCPLLESVYKYVRKSTPKVLLLLDEKRLNVNEFLTVEYPSVTINSNWIKILCYFDS